MLYVLASIIPLSIGSILASPIIFVIAIVLLSQKYYPKVKLAAFALPVCIMSIIATIGGYILGQTMVERPDAVSFQDTADIFISLAFFFLAFLSWFAKPKKQTVEKNAAGKNIIKWFTIGALAAITNWDALILIMAAGKEVGSSTLDQFAKWLLLFINIFISTLAVTFPLFLTLLFPKHARAILKEISLFLKQYSKVIVTVLFFVFGVVFLNKAFPFF